MSDYKQAIQIFGDEIVNEFVKIMKTEDRLASGRLAKSMKAKIIDNKKGYGIRLLAANYYKFVDEGRKPGGKMPPMKAISKWASIRGISQDRVWAIRKSIQQNGIKPANITSRGIQNITTIQAYRKFETDTYDWVDEQIDDMLKNLTVTKSEKLGKVSIRI